MAEVGQKDLVRTVIIALWGMVTLLLLFTVGFLLVEMTQRERNGTLLGSVQDGPFPASEDFDGRNTRGIRLYFAHREKTALVSETRRIAFGDRTVDNCRTVLEALIEGPRELMGPVLPPLTTIRAIYLLGTGELVVDFSRDLEAGQIKSATAELLMAQAVASSLCQESLRGKDGQAVLSVRFLFEGSPAQETFPVHIDLSGPVIPDPRLIDLGTAGSDDV